MSRFRSLSIAIALGSATLASHVASADAADTTAPVISGFKVTPTTICRSKYDQNPWRTVTFTLSEPAKVTLYKLELVSLLTFQAPTQATISLPAGPQRVASDYERDGPPAPSLYFTFPSAAFDAGWWAISAQDAAGNRSPQRWSQYLGNKSDCASIPAGQPGGAPVGL